MTFATTTTAQPKERASADALLKKYSTQLTAALAVVVCITGVMMFFHLYKGEVEAMHEWLGMGFVAAVALHLTRHRKPLAMMITQNQMKILMAVTALIAAAFLVGSPAKQSGNPMRMTIKAVLSAPISDVAPVFGLSTDAAITQLTAAGARNATPAESIDSLAKASKTEPFKLLATLAERGESASQTERD